MRITIPWSGIALVGGVAALTMTDWPSIVGWVLVIWGTITLILQFLVVTIMGVGTRAVKKAVERGDLDISNIQDFYKTNHGRSLVQKTDVRGLRAKGNVTIDPTQK